MQKRFLRTVIGLTCTAAVSVFLYSGATAQIAAPAPAPAAAGTVRVAAVNAAGLMMDIPGSLAKADRIVAKAKADGVTFVVFPELWMPGFVDTNDVNTKQQIGMLPLDQMPKYIASCISRDSAEWKRLGQIAAKHGVYLSMGICERSEADHHIYMVQVMFDPTGKQLDAHRKINPSGGERIFFSDAVMKDNLHVVGTPIGRIGALSCGEHFKPMMTYNMGAQHEDIHVAAWPINVPKSDIWWEKWHMAMINSAYYAENIGSWVIAASIGHSGIFNPNGEIVAEADNTNSDYAVADIQSPRPRGRFQQPADGGQYSYNILGLLAETYPGTKQPAPPQEKLNLVDYTTFK